MTALNKQALRSREEFEEYYNETHAVKVTSQFKRFGYYVSPTMQKAWELWQKAQSSMRDELKSAENNLIDSECHVAELEEALRDKQALLEAEEERYEDMLRQARSFREAHDSAAELIRKLERNKPVVKLPTTKLWAGKVACYEESEIIALLTAAGIGVKEE